MWDGLSARGNREYERECHTELCNGLRTGGAIRNDDSGLLIPFPAKRASVHREIKRKRHQKSLATAANFHASKSNASMTSRPSCAQGGEHERITLDGISAPHITHWESARRSGIKAELFWRGAGN